MKLAILNSNYCTDLATLKAIPFATINHGDKKFVDGNLYEWFVGAIDGIEPDDIEQNQKPNGRWVNKGSAHTLISVVDDAYDFIANDATDLSDTPENTVLNFCKFGTLLIGQFENFRDYLCCREEIKKAVNVLAGAGWVNYPTLSQDIRTAASKYIPTKIIDNVSFIQLVTDCLGNVSLAKQRLDEGMRLNAQARDMRYAVMVNYAYQKLGKFDGLSAEDVVLANNLKFKFVERGRMRAADEGGLDGLVDWLEASGNYVADGLQAKIVNNEITIKDATTTQDFIDKCVAIVEKGEY